MVTTVALYFTENGFPNIALEYDGEYLTGLKFDVNGELCGENASEALKCAGAVRWLDMYFGGAAPDFLPKIRLKNVTEFQRTVYDELLKIPYGQTVSYLGIARKISATMSAQAVGGAVGKNPIALILPCHRVTNSNNGLGGYAYGTEIKAALLRLEGIII